MNREEILLIIKILLFSSIVPIMVHMFFKTKLNKFFIFLLISLLFSFVTEGAGIISTKVYGTNLLIYGIYLITNSILMGLMWCNTPTYQVEDTKRIKYFTLFVTSILTIALLTLGIERDTIFIMICIHLLMLLIHALYYFYKLFKNPNAEIEIINAYFITALAFIILPLSTILQLAALQLYPEFRIEFLFVRCWFFLIFNVIIAYAFYHLHKNSQS